MRRHFPSRRLLQILLVSSGFLFLAGLLAWLIFEPVRIFVAVPLEFIVWIVRTLYLLVPRYAWWILFLVAAYMIVLNGLAGKTSRFHWTSTRSEELYAEPKVARIARYIRLRTNPFYSHRLNHLVTEVALRVLAYQEQSSFTQARLALNRGSIGYPPEIERFLKIGLPPWPDPPLVSPGLFDRLLPNRHSQTKRKIEAEQVLDFLEDALEVSRAD